jgi:hypothetical protein
MELKPKECATFVTQLDELADSMGWSIPIDLHTLPADGVASDSVDLEAYRFLDTVSKIIILNHLRYPMNEVRVLF